MSFLKNLGSKPLQMTESLPINKESKDLEEMRVYISTLSKKLKKETKNISLLIECASQLSTTFNQFSSSVLVNESGSPLGTFDMNNNVFG